MGYDIGDRVIASPTQDRSYVGTIVRMDVGDYLVFLDDPVDGEDTVWVRADQLRMLG
jgi:hypothetical protein